MTFAIAIDDDAKRYDYFRVLLEARGIAGKVLVVTCDSCIKTALAEHPNVPILLDYDLDGAEGCRSCQMDQGPHKGSKYLPLLAGRNVIVSSANRQGGMSLARWLRENSPGRVALHGCAEPDPELRWIGVLWSWGLL